MIRAFTWGTFDFIHNGHKLFLNNIKSVSDELHIVLIPNIEVYKNKNYIPLDTNTRKANLQKLDIADLIHIDCYNWGLKSVIKHKPDVFVLGYDQRTIWEKRLLNFLRNRNLDTIIITLEEFADGIHSSHFR